MTERETVSDRAADIVVGAVVTAFFPGDNLARLIDELTGQVRCVVVVDNTPTAVAGETVRPDGRVVFLSPGENIGLAAALNLGARHLTETLGVTHIGFWDQDSLPPAGYTDFALARAAELPEWPWTIVSGAHGDVRTGNDRPAAGTDTGTVALITSGMVVPAAVLDRVGAFREDFFVDAVDLDYSLRARAAGVSLHRFPELVIQHRMGDARGGWRRTGILAKIGTHAPWRHYWICRNMSILVAEHRRTDPAAVRTIRVGLMLWLVLVLVAGPNRRTALAAAVAGLRDARRRVVRAQYDPRQVSVAGLAGTGRTGRRRFGPRASRRSASPADAPVSR